MADPIVVVGGGLAAATAVTELREKGYAGPLVLVSEEEHPPYERPPLSKDLLLGTGEAADALVHPEEWYAEHDVELRLGSPVTALDLANRTVTVEGRPLRYERLLLATGSRPRRLPMAEESGVPVSYLRTLDDALRLKDRLTAGTRVAIIGGGWIGLEVAAAARHHDAQVTVVESAEQPLLRVLGEEVAAVFAALHRSHGVDLRTGARLTGIEPADEGALLRFADGDPVECDLLVVGVGVEPVVELAEAAGLRVDDGIRTDAHLRTSDDRVHAAGDVANADHPVLGRPVRVEHWDTARQHGTVAAHNLAGGDEEHRELPYFFTDQYDLGMEYVGSPGPEGFDRVVVRGDTSGPEALEFTAWWLRGDEVVAGMHVNDWDAIDDVRRLVGQHVDADRLADTGTPLAEVGQPAS
ncbi:MAG: pyridine nucleotide-disulfide oxidoreductase [Marmoricola sp.]|nr:pyridine nucleotide-disulfide oxidoreductase [Marmoricola sp.]